MLDQPVPLDKLIEVKTEPIREYEEMERKTIVSVQYPSPEGAIRVTREQVNAWWAGHEVPFTPARTKAWNAADKEEASFLYVTAVDMYRRGYLTESLEPTAAAKAAKADNAAVPLPSSIQIHNAFPSDPSAGASTAPAPPAPAPAPSVAALAEKTAALALAAPSASTSSINYKVILNETFPTTGTTNTIVYTSRATGPGHALLHVATVTVNGTPYEGTEAKSKKEAEKLAAYAALRALGKL